MTNLALIDADELAFKISTSYQQKYYTILKDDKKLWRVRYKEEAIESIGNRDDLEIGEEVEIYDFIGYDDKIDSVVNRITSSTNSSRSLFFLSGESNFRYNLATLLPYKGNRPEERPVYLRRLQDCFRDRGATSIDFLEADDLLSINSIIHDNTVICSSDKDLRTVPSLNYNINNDSLESISEEDAIYNFYYQLLIGDTVDNIPSPYLLGKETATKFLTKCRENGDNYYQQIIPFYSKYLLAKDKKGEYKTKWYSSTTKSVEEILFEIGNLLWMRRTLDPEERWDPNG